MPAAKITTSARNPRSPWRMAARPVSTGAAAWLRMSQSKKIRTPVAMALSKPWTAFETPRIRPTGSPMKMVPPAMAPSAAAAK